MRNLYLIIFFMCFSFIQAQDTTSYRMIGVSSGMELDYFYDDSTSMGDIALTGSSGHAIFVNPADSLVYAVLDVTGGDRNLFKINPFTGAFNLTFNFSAAYINSADIADDGNVYAITGFGGGTNGEIFKLNMSTLTESIWDTSSVDDARALEFNPVDSSIYIYEAFNDTAYTTDLTTITESGFSTTGMNDEIHGAYFDEDASIFFISAYGGEMYTTNATWNQGTMYHDMDNGVSGNNVMDLCEFSIIASTDSMLFCKGDSQRIFMHYNSNYIRWFRDGNVVANQRDSFIYADSAGTYQALVGIQMTNGRSYMWSEPVVVQHYTSPNVTIKSAGGDSTLCSGDSIMLIGAVGGSLQWYFNGIAISGATSPNYYAKSIGSYNQEKTNMSGCSDSSAAPFILYDVPRTTASVSSNDTLWCDGETITLTGVSTGNLQWYMNGTAIGSATSGTYDATAIGNYNMSGTNECGIADSAIMGIGIVQDPNCPDGIVTFDKSNLTVFPNPVKDKLYISSDYTINKVRISNLQGKLVYEDELINYQTQVMIDLSMIPTGMYIIEANTEEGLVSMKFIKE